MKLFSVEPRAPYGLPPPAADALVRVSGDAAADAPPGDGTGWLTTPTVVTLLGYGASLAWLLGGPAWLGIASVLADELDGWSARYLHEESAFGRDLDWAVDLTLTPLTALRAGLPLWAVLPLTVGQVWYRQTGGRPVGSPRAVFTLYSIVARDVR